MITWISIRIQYKSKYNVNEKKIIVLPSGSSIKKNFKFKKKIKYLKIGYFGSLYKSRGFKLILELSKIDKNNNYYVYGGDKRIISNLKKRMFKIKIYIYINTYLIKSWNNELAKWMF